MVRREDNRPKAIGSRGGLGRRDSERSAQRYARIVAASERCAADVRDASIPTDRAGRHLVTRRRTQRLLMGFTGPSVVRLESVWRCGQPL